MTRRVSKATDVRIVRLYRICCPQCGQVGDLAESEVTAREVRREHWARHWAARQAYERTTA